jgi:NitT/TauT family transport system ATP-binding protein
MLSTPTTTSFKLTSDGVTVPGETGCAIRVTEVEKHFATPQGPIRALSRTSLPIRQGEFAVLLGPSGCGKTTMLRLMAGLERPSTGTVEVGGRQLWVNERRDDGAVANMGMVFQDANLFPWLTIADNIALPLKLRGTQRKQRRERARELCRLVGIAGFEERWPRELSGGMRQRASIARALSYDPEILLMDEPFGALDAITREAMNIELQRIWLATSKTVVLVTHSIPEAVFLADRVLLLSQRPGRIDEIVDVPFARPRDINVQSLPAFQEIVDRLRRRLEH